MSGLLSLRKNQWLNPGSTLDAVLFAHYLRVTQSIVENVTGLVFGSEVATVTDRGGDVWRIEFHGGSYDVGQLSWRRRVALPNVSTDPARHVLCKLPYRPDLELDVDSHPEVAVMYFLRPETYSPASNQEDHVAYSVQVLMVRILGQNLFKGWPTC